MSTRLSQELQRLGIGAATLARLLDVEPRLVDAWIAGAEPLPGPVAAYLRVVGQLEPTALKAEVGLLRRAPGQLADGVYRLDYKGLYNSGICLLLISAGRIAGIDTGGGAYHGTCEPVGGDRHRLQVRLTIPPGQILVNGARAGPEGAAIDIAATLATPRPVSQALVELAGGPVEVSMAYLSPLPAAGGA